MIWKNDSGARDLEGLPHYEAVAFGARRDALTVEEGGLRFRAPASGGQKTGWFFDQAANRLALRKYVGAARVLDVFSYLGAWGLGALARGRDGSRLASILPVRLSILCRRTPPRTD